MKTFALLKKELDRPYSDRIIAAGKAAPGGDIFTRVSSATMTVLVMEGVLTSEQAVAVATLQGAAWGYLNKFPGNAEQLDEVIAFEASMEQEAGDGGTVILDGELIAADRGESF